MYGATILGKGVQHNLFGRLMSRYGHWQGCFCNLGDSQVALVQEMEEHFEHVESWVIGAVWMFKASKPRIED